MIINRKTPEIIALSGRSQRSFYVAVSLNQQHVYFTAAVTRFLNIQDGQYVNFINDGDGKWDFYLNDDPDGFKLSQIKWKKGFIISNTALVRMILKSTGHRDEKRFNVINTGSQIDGRPVYSLTLDNVSTSIN